MNHSVEEVRLKNGARGLLIDIPGATVMNMQFQFRAGNRYAKSQDIEQVAHIMEHMAFGANKRFKNEHDFEVEFTKNGAYRNAYTNDLSMVYEADCADFEWDRILDLQKLSICEPKFNEEELISEKGNVRGELTNYLNDHYRVLYPRVQQLLGEDTLTYRQSLATINNVTLKDIKEHHKRTHTTKNMRFVITGNLKGRKAEIKRQLESFNLPEGERLEAPNDILHSAEPALIRRKSATNLTFGLFLTVPEVISDSDLDAMSFLNHILTGTTYSRIFGAARKKGLAYSVSSYTGIGAAETTWEITGQVNHDTAKDVFEIISKQLACVLEKSITAEELEATKSFVFGRYQMGAQTVSQISNFYIGRYFSDEFVRDYSLVPQQIKKVTVDKMINVAERFFKENIWVLAGVSNNDKQQIIDLAAHLNPLFNHGDQNDSGAKNLKGEKDALKT